MTPSGFKPAIPASEQPQTPSLDSAATGIGGIYWGGTMNTSHERKSVHTLRLVSELTFFSWTKTGMILKPASDHGRKLTSCFAYLPILKFICRLIQMPGIVGYYILFYRFNLVPTCLSVYICLCVYLSNYVSIYLSTYPSTYLHTHLLTTYLLCPYLAT